MSLFAVVVALAALRPVCLFGLPYFSSLLSIILSNVSLNPIVVAFPCFILFRGVEDH